MSHKIYVNIFAPLVFSLVVILASNFTFPILSADAQGATISYPIPELGNCGSQEECKAFCDDVANYVACTRWAAKNNLVSPEKVTAVEEEVKKIEKFESGEIPEGPGGCKTPAECEAYCAKPEHGEECFKFGMEHGLISPQEAKEIQRQMKEMKGPGGCKSKEECDAYCAKPENAEDCINYAIKDGTLTQAEANELLAIVAKERERREAIPPQPEKFHPEPKEPEINKEKMTEILKTQKGPGGCSTLEECKKYCEDLSHAEECLSFIEKNGLVSSKDVEQMKTMTEVMKTTGGPGGCKSPKECDEYCSLPEHQSECLKFAKEHNLISPEEAKLMEKMAGGGPGGCRNQQECDAYCSDPQHMEECLEFSVKQGIMTKEEAQRMIEIMKRQEKRGLQMKGKPPTKGGPMMPHMFEGGMPKQNEWPGPGGQPSSGAPGPENFDPMGPMPPGGQMLPAGMMPPEGAMPPEGFEGHYEGPMLPPESQYGPPPGEGQYYGPPPSGEHYGPPPEGSQYGPPPSGEEYGPPPSGEYYGPPSGEEIPSATSSAAGRRLFLLGSIEAAWRSLLNIFR